MKSPFDTKKIAVVSLVCATVALLFFWVIMFSGNAVNGGIETDNSEKTSRQSPESSSSYVGSGCIDDIQIRTAVIDGVIEEIVGRGSSIHRVLVCGPTHEFPFAEHNEVMKIEAWIGQINQESDRSDSREALTNLRKKNSDVERVVLSYRGPHSVEIVSADPGRTLVEGGSTKLRELFFEFGAIGYSTSREFAMARVCCLNCPTVRGAQDIAWDEVRAFRRQDGRWQLVGTIEIGGS